MIPVCLYCMVFSQRLVAWVKAWVREARIPPELGGPEFNRERGADGVRGILGN